MGGGHVNAIAVTVNGLSYSELVEPRLLLSDFLRHTLGLTGTHVGCEHGVCGACTVRLDGAAIETVEGLAANGDLHPLQEAFRKHHALQCGFCTSGMLMAAADLLENRAAAPTREEIVDMLSGHLCRCTGYEPIVDAIADVAGSS